MGSKALAINATDIMLENDHDDLKFTLASRKSRKLNCKIYIRLWYKTLILTDARIIIAELFYALSRRCHPNKLWYGVVDHPRGFSDIIWAHISAPPTNKMVNSYTTIKMFYCTFINYRLGYVCWFFFNIFVTIYIIVISNICFIRWKAPFAFLNE